MKNRVLPLLLAVLLLFSACAQPAPSSSSEIVPVDPYEYLLLPEGVKMGTPFEDARESIEFTSEVVTPNNAYALLRNIFGPNLDNPDREDVALGHYCYLAEAEYNFEAKKPIDEFENIAYLKDASFRVVDRISYENRTKEKHGDIVAEFEVIEQFLIEHYGEPVKTDKTWERTYRSYWDIEEENMGIDLRIKEITGDGCYGELTLRYFSTEGYVDNWYDV